MEGARKLSPPMRIGNSAPAAVVLPRNAPSAGALTSWREYTLPAVSTGDGPGAYRDDRPSLAAENARLRAELAGLRGARRSRAQRAAAVVAVLLLDAWVFTLVVGWVNTPRDAEVWLGWAVAALTLGMNVVAAKRLLRPRT